jgi:hypothetical protein
VGRGCGLGRDRGVGVALGVAVGVGVALGVTLGVGVGVGVGLGATGTIAYACVSPLCTAVPTITPFSLMPSADEEVFIDKSQPEPGGIRSARRYVFVPS